MDLSSVYHKFPPRLHLDERRLVVGGRDAVVVEVEGVAQHDLLLGTMYFLIGFRKSTPPQSRRLNILISNSKL